MKKPEKYKHVDEDVDKDDVYDPVPAYESGWNNAIAEYEAYLPDEDELEKIVETVMDECVCGEIPLIAEAIAKRIGKSKDDNARPTEEKEEV